MPPLPAISPVCLAFGDPSMLIRYWWMLVLVPPAVVGLIVSTWLAWTVARMARRELAGRLDRRATAKARFQPDGAPWPMHQRGLCDVCWGAHDRVYHFADDRRICHDCYTRAGCERGAPRPACRDDSRAALEI